ncbi:Methyltransferase FkbM [Trinorchestia longiramus]|nr:Methyltransferase FkbM [Trinorchestia longiramus]
MWIPRSSFLHKSQDRAVQFPTLLFRLELKRLRRSAGLVIMVAAACIIALKSSWKTAQDTKHCRLLGPLSEDDPFVINELRLNYLHEATGLPGEHPEQQSASSSFSINFSQEFYNRVIRELFLHKRVARGYFVEAGALDGIYASNTLKLEMDLDWSGLLIEPDRAMYKLLLAAKRRSRFLSACISPHRYPYKALMRTLSPAVVDSKNAIAYKSMNALVTDPQRDDRTEQAFSLYQEVQCFPITSILMAADVTNITLFSLDVEDVEWEILETFPFERVQVDVWFIEHRKIDRRGIRRVEYDPLFVQWFAERSYTLYDYEEHNVADYVFVRNTSSFALNKTTRPTKTSFL